MDDKYDLLESSITDPYETSGDDDPDYEYNPQKEIKKPKLLSDYFRLRCETTTRDALNTQTPCKSLSQSQTISSGTEQQALSSQDDLILKKKIQNSSILDGKFFGVIGKVTDINHIQAECKMCLPKKTVIKGSVDISTNFVKHIKNKHNEQIEIYRVYKEEKRRNRMTKTNFKNWNIETDDGNSSTSTSTASSISLTKAKRPLKQAQFLFPQSKVAQKDFDERIIRFIVESMSPISIICHQSFINIFKGMNLKVMSRFAAIQKVDNEYQNMITSIKQQLSGCDFVCTTADIWSSKRRSFMGVTCHWIDQNLTRHSVALSCRRFEGVHSFDRIGELLDEINKYFGLDNKKILATITDNGANFIKCFKEFGIMLNDGLQATSNGFDKIEENHEEEESPEFINVTMSFESETSKSLSSEFKVCNFLPDHLRCASHTINLIATTDYNNSLQSSHQLRSKNCQTFNKCSNLWNKARRPKSAEIIQEVLGCTLSYPGVTRWNSTYDAIQTILAYKEKLLELCNKLLVPNLSDNDFSFLEEYSKIMKPLAETLDFLQGDKNTYYGYLLPSIVSMHTKLEKIKLSGNIKQLSKSLDYILDSIVKKRFKDIFMLQSQKAVIAAVTHPMFKMRWFNAFKGTDVSVTPKDIQSWIIDAALEFKDLVEPDVVASEDIPGTFFDFKDDNVMLTPQLQHSISNELLQNQFEFELLKYLNDKRTNLEMLNDYKVVRKIFIKYNTILPSSAPVERLFSFAQIINAPRRHALSDTNFEKLVLLKSNVGFK